jgi:hypothetical protein
LWLLQCCPKLACPIDLPQRSIDETIRPEPCTEGQRKHASRDGPKQLRTLGLRPCPGLVAEQLPSRTANDACRDQHLPRHGGTEQRSVADQIDQPWDPLSAPIDLA